MVFQFNQITLDTAQYRLCLSGNPISVEPQVFDLLIYLVENRDRVVTRDELLENLWKGKVVTDAALGVRLKDARKAVNDNGTKQEVIKTVHGRGYQFIAEVKESPTDATSEKKEVLTTMDLLALSEKPSIAVLPFTNMSNDPEQEFFSDGITEDIITELSRFAVLYVVARHSSFVFKSEKMDIKEVAEKLGVQYLVEGSVRRAGNRVRITAQLIEAKTGNHIWAERYDRELEDIFAVQDEVTQSIVALLPGRVQENVAERASRKPTDNMKAYEFMLQAKSIRDSFNTVDTARARSLFEKAIELDPRYARAYMYLSDTYLVDILLGIEMADTSQKMVELTRKAVSLDSNEIAIQEQLGYVYIVEGLWENAELQFDKCLRKIVNEAEQML